VANLIPIGIVVAERCLYLPSLAVCLMAAAVIHRLTEKRAWAGAVVVMALSVTAVFLSARVAVRWRTPLRHWETTAADHPRSPAAHARFALLLLAETARDTPGRDDARLAKADEALNRALALNPRLPEAWHGRGVLAVLRGDCAAAKMHLARALALRPGDPEILQALRACP
jgi:protein O-mannosyl-transferase